MFFWAFSVRTDSFKSPDSIWVGNSIFLSADVSYCCYHILGHRWPHIGVSPQHGQQRTHSWGELWFRHLSFIQLLSFSDYEVQSMSRNLFSCDSGSVKYTVTKFIFKNVHYTACTDTMFNRDLLSGTWIRKVRNGCDIITWMLMVEYLQQVICQSLSWMYAEFKTCTQFQKHLASQHDGIPEQLSALTWGRHARSHHQCSTHAS